MREDIKALIQANKNDIAFKVDLFDDEPVEDWFYYADDYVLNVHDYDEDGIINVDVYGYDENDAVDWGKLIYQTTITQEEFYKL